MLGGGDTGEMGRMGIPTMAYASNVFFGNPEDFGARRRHQQHRGRQSAPSSRAKRWRNSRQTSGARNAAWQARLAGRPRRRWLTLSKKDYRPTANSGAKERGVKYFVPWALARTVGEWNFYKSASTPQVVLGEGFYMTDEYLDRGMYYFIPRNDLTVSGCSAGDYVAGPLEDWIEGALAFDGKRVASLSHAEMTRSMKYPGARGTADDRVRRRSARRSTWATTTSSSKSFSRLTAGQTERRSGVEAGPIRV